MRRADETRRSSGLPIFKGGIPTPPEPLAHERIEWEIDWTMCVPEEEIQIGAFGMLEYVHAQLLTDTYEFNGHVAERWIELPDGDCIVRSGRLMVFSRINGVPEWHGSEKIRRERERSALQVRSREDSPRGGRQQGEVHGSCPVHDHPEKHCTCEAPKAER